MFDPNRLGSSVTQKSVEDVKSSLTVFHISKEEAEKMKAEHRRSPAFIEVERNGVKETVAAGDEVARLEKNGVSIVVDAESAEHIYATHISPDAPPGSRFEGIKDLNTLFDTIKQKFDFLKIQKSLEEGSGPLEEKKFVGTLDIEEEMKTVVATLEEAKEKLGISKEDIDEYRKHRNEIILLNKSGDEEKKRAFIEAYNSSHLESRVYLSQRFPTAPITSFFDGEDIETTELTIVVIDSKLITTMPGHHREKLPFSPKVVWEYATPRERADLIQQFGSEEEALKRVEEDFVINAKDWIEAGFIQKRAR